MRTRKYSLPLIIVIVSLSFAFVSPVKKGPTQKPFCEAVNYLLTHFEKGDLKKIYNEKTAKKSDYSVVWEPVITIEGFIEQEVNLSSITEDLRFEAYYDYDESKVSLEQRNKYFKEMVEKIETCTGKKGEFTESGESLSYEMKIKDVTLILGSNKSKVISFTIIAI
jgi:hypothetical protein